MRDLISPAELERMGYTKEQIQKHGEACTSYTADEKKPAADKKPKTSTEKKDNHNGNK